MRIIRISIDETILSTVAARPKTRARRDVAGFRPPMPARPTIAATPDAPLPAAQRAGLSVAVLVAHGAVGWALWHQAVDPHAPQGKPAPIEVNWIAPAEPPPAPTPSVPPVADARPAPRPPPVRPRPLQAPARESAPLLVAASGDANSPPRAPAPQPRAETVADPVPVTAPASAPAATPAPPVPAAPRTVAITQVEYLAPPVLHYPPASRRAHEEGRVHVAVVVDATGAPQQIALVRSSGHARLDEAALATVRATRFRPYRENGVPMSFRVLMPLVFELEH